MDAEAVVWDFDGVLNRNIRNGRLLWQDDFEADTGCSAECFQRLVFGPGFDAVMTGKVDLRSRVAAWARAVRYEPGADALIAYWFARDALPDDRVLALLQRSKAAGIRAVIGTNNEPLRTSYIERDMGYGRHVERIYSSGRLGVAKPDPAFFEHIADDLGVAADRLVLIDDSARNVAAALALGWQAFHFAEAAHDALEAFLFPR